METVTVQQIINIVIGMGALVGAILSIYQLYIKLIKPKFNKSLTKKITDVSSVCINRSTEELIGEISKLSGVLDDFINESKSASRAQEILLRSLAQDRINQAHRIFIEQGEIDDYSMCIIENLYDGYSKMGGNGHATQQIKHLRELGNKHDEK